MITLVTGGARSGKSRYAQERALQASDQPVYVATAKAWDAEFSERIERHRSERDARWTNMEALKDLSALPLENRVVVIDCVTLWLNNLFVEFKQDIEACLDFLRKQIDALEVLNAEIIIITNELGMGLHADTEVGRKFTDLQGWANQYIASRAVRVVFMVSGIPLTIKE